MILGQVYIRVYKAILVLVFCIFIAPQNVVADDVFNNFQNTDKTLAEIAVTDVKVVLLVGALNRSPIYDTAYKGLPVIASIREAYPEYEQDDPAVAADIAAGNIEMEVKKNWPRLMAVMNQ